MSELIAALNQLEKEKGIDKDVIMEAIENSLLAACKRDFGSADNVVVNMDRETGDIYLVAEVLGHNDVNTTRKHYAAQADERRRQAAKAVRLRDK